MLYDVNILAIIQFLEKFCSTSQGCSLAIVHFNLTIFGRSTGINGFLLMITYVSTDQWEC